MPNRERRPRKRRRLSVRKRRLKAQEEEERTAGACGGTTEPRKILRDQDLKNVDVTSVRVSVLNLRGLCETERMRDVVKIMEREKLVLCALCETHLESQTDADMKAMIPDNM